MLGRTGTLPPAARTIPRAGRRAVAAVEFALVLPFIAVFVSGMAEIGRAIMVRHVLNDAARKGCRQGALPNRTSANITSDVNDILTDNGIASANATVTIQVNGVTADAFTAVKGDKIPVKVCIPF